MQYKNIGHVQTQINLQAAMLTPVFARYFFFSIFSPFPYYCTYINFTLEVKHKLPFLSKEPRKASQQCSHTCNELISPTELSDSSSADHIKQSFSIINHIRMSQREGLINLAAHSYLADHQPPALTLLQLLPTMIHRQTPVQTVLNLNLILRFIFIDKLNMNF